MITPDGQQQGLNPQDLNHQGDRQWHSLMDWISGWVRYPATYTEKKFANDVGANVIDVFGLAEYRVNAEGFIVFRGLLRKNPATALAVGNVVISMPRFLMPKSPHQHRFFGQTCTLTLNPDTQQLVVDQLLAAGADYVSLNNVMYYLD